MKQFSKATEVSPEGLEKEFTLSKLQLESLSPDIPARKEHGRLGTISTIDSILL